MSDRNLPAERLRLLCKQVGEEIGQRWGQKSEIARRIGLDQPHVSQIMDKHIGVKWDPTIEKVIAKLGVHPAFFTDPDYDSPHYRDFIGKPATKVISPPGIKVDSHMHSPTVRYNKTVQPERVDSGEVHAPGERTLTTTESGLPIALVNFVALLDDPPSAEDMAWLKRLAFADGGTVEEYRDFYSARLARRKGKAMPQGDDDPPPDVEGEGLKVIGKRKNRG